jgi:hypothetical protein
LGSVDRREHPMTLATPATYERWEAERAGRRQAARETLAALEGMTPLWMANTASMGDGIDQQEALRIVREIGGLDR